MLTYFVIGAAIGAITGVPIGPVNVAVIDAAYRQSLRRAIAVGLGGAAADFLYAGLGILGLGPVLHRHPVVPPILFGVSGIVLIIYGAITMRAQELEPHEVDQPTQSSPALHFAGGVGVGVALILLNPGALVTWVVIVGSFMGGVTRAQGVAAVIGVGVGSFAWFTLVANLAHHGKKILGKKLVWLTRLVGLLLIGYGVFSIGRAIYLLHRLL